MILLSVDPGVVNIGWSISIVDQLEAVKKYPLAYQFLEYGILNVGSKESTYNDKMDAESFHCLNFFDELLTRHSITHVAWETTPSWGGFGQQSRILSNLSALRVLTWQKKKWFKAVHPTTVKTQLTGNSKASKIEVTEEVWRRWPQFDESEKKKKDRTSPDLFDAIAVGVVAVEKNDWRRF